MDKKERAEAAELIEKEFCSLTNKLANRHCPNTFKRKVPKINKYGKCIYHNLRHDSDNLYIHHIMNTEYKRDGRYEISWAMRENDFIRKCFAGLQSTAGADYPRLRKLLTKLNRSPAIRLAIKTVDPPPQDIRDRYGNYQEVFPNERITSKLRKEVEWRYLNGAEFDQKLKRELSRKYHLPYEDIQFFVDCVRDDLKRYSPKELELIKRAEEYYRKLENDQKKKANKKGQKI